MLRFVPKWLPFRNPASEKVLRERKEGRTISLSLFAAEEEEKKASSPGRAAHSRTEGKKGGEIDFPGGLLAHWAGLVWGCPPCSEYGAVIGF